MYYALSNSITDLGEDIVQYMEFTDEFFLRQVDQIISDCPYAEFSRNGRYINSEQDSDIMIIGCPQDYHSLKQNISCREEFITAWRKSISLSNIQKIKSDNLLLEKIRLKVNILVIRG